MAKAPRADEKSAGRARRAVVRRSEQARWEPAPGRPDPIDLLSAQNRGRIASLVPVRWGRMLESPFAFLRGAAAVMAGDLATTPTTGISVQTCGDAHVANFGVFASPERILLFDVNDFDETWPGPFEWDLKRLATSAVVVARSTANDESAARDAARAAVTSYRRHMKRYAAMHPRRLVRPGRCRCRLPGSRISAGASPRLGAVQGAPPHLASRPAQAHRVDRRRSPPHRRSPSARHP
jgi:hypothetical protein